jgi:glycine/D-amino acid oxidase-like deaminating enzyme
MTGVGHIETFDAIVIGAGVVGAACAEALSADGRRVLILESGIAGGGTTAAGMGHLVAMDDSPAQLALTSYSLRLWGDLFDSLPPTAELDRCGTLWIAENDEQLAAVRQKQETYAQAGVATDVLDERATAAAEPNLRRGLVGSLRVPGDSVVYPPGAALALIERAKTRGSVLREHASVTRIVANGVECDGRAIGAEVVVNAAGASAPALTPGVPIVPRKGHLAITDRYPGFCHHQIVELGYLTSAHVMTNESVAFNVQPRRTGQVLIGSSRELVGWDASLNPRILRQMLARAVTLMPRLAELSVIRVWTGFRPTTEDKLPLIGRWEGVDGLWIAAGHEGLGITTSTATGRLIADLVAGRPTAIDATPFAPARIRQSSDAKREIA